MLVLNLKVMIATMLEDFLTVMEDDVALNLHLEAVKRFCRQVKVKRPKVNNGRLIKKPQLIHSLKHTKRHKAGLQGRQLTGIVRKDCGKQHLLVNCH